MPEGPELLLSSLFVNRVCKNIIFSGSVTKNPIHKCNDISWNEQQYTISAESKGKELKINLNSCRKSDEKPDQKGKSCSILFTFGMSGKFEFTPADSLLKHSHLSFFSEGTPKMALSFVDYRRFGKWHQGAPWSSDRGPCVIQEKEQFFQKVVDCLENTAFKKPICEVMLNQKFFNGIGNYLRAEILFRCKVPPFERANAVLKLDERENVIKEEIKQEDQKAFSEIKKEVNRDVAAQTRIRNGHSKEQRMKQEIKQEPVEEGDMVKRPGFSDLTPKAQELLHLCHTLPLEVVKIGSTKYTYSDMYKEDAEGDNFMDWLQCYYQPGMKNLADHNNRTIWFSGPPGALVPKEQKSRGMIMKMTKSAKASKGMKVDEAKEVPKKKKLKVKGGKKSQRLTRRALELEAISSSDKKIPRRVKGKQDMKERSKNSASIKTSGRTKSSCVTNLASLDKNSRKRKRTVDQDVAESGTKSSTGAGATGKAKVKSRTGGGKAGGRARVTRATIRQGTD